jgi:hypothetical protein
MSDTTARPAPKDRQRRRSPIRRPHDEGPGRFEYRPIRAIGARVGRLLSHVELGLGVCFRGTGSGGIDDWRDKTNGCGCDWRGRVRFRPGIGGPV